MNRLTRRRSAPKSSRSLIDVWNSVGMLSYNGHPINAVPMMSMPGTNVERPDGSFEALSEQVHKSSDVISAAIVARSLLLSQLRFKWKNLSTGQLFGDPSLGALEYPNDSQTRPELLTLAEFHASLGGSAYFHRENGTGPIRLLRPDWTAIVMGSQRDAKDAAVQRDAEIVGYGYKPGGASVESDWEFFPAEDVAHWRPEPDPVAWWRGSSWVQTVLSEFLVDTAAQEHTLAFFGNAATPQMVFTFDPQMTADQVKQFADIVEDGHEGAARAYKSLFIGGGADAKVVGSDLSRLDMKSVTGLAETRVAVRSRVPAVILGVSEGLGGSALNAGNYTATRRQWSDGWFSPTAEGLCSVLERIVPAPAGAEMSFDPSAVMFLQDDRLDESNIQQAQAITLRNLVDAGFDPASAIEAVTSGDFTKLKHNGLYSVQLQAPGAMAPAPDGAPTNG